MKLRYRYFGKEDYAGHYVTYDFPVPFHENFDKELKSIFGEDLSFVKEIDHARRIIRLHSGYDSGKGYKYTPPEPFVRRKRVDVILKEIFLQSCDHKTFELYDEAQDENWYLLFGERYIQIFTDASVHNNQISGYKTVIGNNYRSLNDFFRGKRFYPSKWGKFIPSS